MPHHYTQVQTFIMVLILTLNLAEHLEQHNFNIYRHFPVMQITVFHFSSANINTVVVPLSIDFRTDVLVPSSGTFMHMWIK